MTSYGRVEGGPHALTPREAVGEAIESAQSALLLRYAKRLPSDTHKDYEVLAQVSAHRCRFASVNSILFLSQNYPNLFKHLMVLQANRVEGTPFKRSQSWKFHAYFLAGDYEQLWYAASPANYSAQQLQLRSELMITGSVEDVINMIGVIEGGRWPDPSYIRRITSRGNSIFPQIVTLPKGDQISCQPLVTVLGTTNSVRMERFKLVTVAASR